MKQLGQFLLLFAVLFSMLPIKAENAVKLCIKLEGRTETFYLSDKPALTFDRQSLYVKSNNVTAVLPYAYDTVKSIYFDVASMDIPDKPSTPDEPIIIDKVDEQDPASAFSFAYDGYTVIITDTHGVASVKVFGLNGQQQQPHIEAYSQQVIIHMDVLSEGIYIIKTDKHSFKVIKK